VPVDSLAMLAASLPLSLVAITGGTLPYALAVLFSLLPTALVQLSVVPVESAFPFSLTSSVKGSPVDAVIGHFCSSGFLPSVEVALEDPFLGHHHSHSLPFLA
jgi:hypothetical protein